MSETFLVINPTMKREIASAVVAGRDGVANVHRLTPTYTSRLPRARLTARLWGEQSQLCRLSLEEGQLTLYWRDGKENIWRGVGLACQTIALSHGAPS